VIHSLLCTAAVRFYNALAVNVTIISFLLLRITILVIQLELFHLSCVGLGR